MAITDILSGAVTLARSIAGPTRAVDVVAIVGGGFSPVFSQARPMSATVYELAELMEHPLETGSVIADHIVHKPIEIELPMICTGAAAYAATYAAIKSSFLSGELLTVITKTGSYSNMVIADMPHDETPSAIDAISIRIRLKEAKFVTPRSELMQSQTADAKQSSTVNRGTQQTTQTTAANQNKATSTVSESGAGATTRPSLAYKLVYGEG